MRRHAQPITSQHPVSPPCHCAFVPACLRAPAAPSLKLHCIPPEDPATYDMICAADTIGVFQIESRAQMSMLPRLRPRCYYDLVIEVAIVRPGPIQGNMVHPYLRRRSGEEPAVYFDDRVRRVLERTLGVPLFQEQAMALAVEAAGFTPGEADQLRRAIAAWKTRGNKIAAFGERIIDGMRARGYPREFAEQCFEQIKGFSGYGFPESHAASFALLVYASAWLKRHHPAAFAAALLNSQPMGFYQPAQIVRDARQHGVEVRPVDVNASAWDCTLEEHGDTATRRRGEAQAGGDRQYGSGGPALRLGTRLVRGVGEADASAIARAVRRAGPYQSIKPLWRASGVRVTTLRRLAKADAFASMGLTRQRALWAIQPLRDTPLPLFDAIEPGVTPDREPGAAPHRRAREADVALPPRTPESEVIADYHGVGLSLRAHPVSFLRDRLDALRVRPNASLADASATPAGRVVRVAGVVLVRQRPGTASGIVFITLEDETGVANLIVRPNIYDQFRRAARHAKVLLCQGKVERQGAVVHVLARSLRSLDQLAPALATASRDFH